MKKVIALVMTVLMTTAVLSGCTTLEKLDDGTYDKGAVINMYLASPTYNFDPQISLTDDSMIKITSLLFEGLTTLNSKGKWEKALMDDYTVKPDDHDGYSVIIDLKKTKWSDGVPVQAKDFVYSWKRVLNPNATGEAASLLYDIKNAREIKRADAGISIDDLGVSAVDTYTLKVTFRNDNVDIDKFFENMSSLALVPIREETVSRYGEDVWAQKPGSILTNGPFTLREVEKDGALRIERSNYYYRNAEKNENLDKYVIPYRLLTDYGKGDVEAQFAAYENDEIFYLGDIPLSKRADYKKEATVEDMATTHTYFFNTKNSVLSKAEVRRALSLAIDREEIVNLITFAKPAVGYVPYKAFDTSYKTEFREEGEDLIATTANMDEAKSLLSSAGVRGGSFTISVRDTEVDVAIAEYAASVWKDLGFNVKVEKLGVGTNSVTKGDTTTVYTVDKFEEKYNSGDFDVIAVDMNMLSPDPFSALSQFSSEFSGNGVDMDSETYEIYTHITGYSSEEYDALIDKAYETEDEDERASLLHEAEKLLMEDMPVCPMAFMQSAYLSSGILSKIKTNYYGATDFKRMKMKNYMDYKDATEEE